jgi:uncharacterized membrane protein YdfJ with MMPL/SSD domain
VLPQGISNSFTESSNAAAAQYFGISMEPPQEVIIEEDESGTGVIEVSHQQRKEANAAKYQKQYQTNPFGKKLKEVSSTNHHNNIEETALLNDLQLHEKKPKAPVSHLKKPSSQRLKNTSDT